MRGGLFVGQGDALPRGSLKLRAGSGLDVDEINYCGSRIVASSVKTGFHVTAREIPITVAFNRELYSRRFAS